MNTKMIKQKVKVFTLGLMGIDIRELIQKSCSSHSWFWSTHQTSWMIIIYERIMGELKDDKIHGKGIETYANGTRYEGEFKDNKIEGKGTKYYLNGRKESGTWKDDVFLG